MKREIMPFEEIWNWGDELGRLFWGLERHRRPSEMALSWSPAMDVKEGEGELTIMADLPGVDKKDVTISVEENVLTLKGERKSEKEEKKGDYSWKERRYGFFARSFTLPKSVDADKVMAKMENGVLEIHIPKLPAARPKTVDITVK